MDTTKEKTKEEKNDDRIKKRSRKRSRKEPNDNDEKKREETRDEHHVSGMTPSARRRQRRKRAKTSQEKASSKTDFVKPLFGTVICVSTLKENVKSKPTTKPSTENGANDKGLTPTSYNAVCQTCKDLGADVIDLVCKRVTLLLCSEAAVKQATQRVRKALKRNKPLVSLEWLEECQKQGRKVSLEKYRLDKKAEDSLQHRRDRVEAVIGNSEYDSGLELVPDAGWSEPKELGCCCVCHENGTTADCPWCVDCKV